METKMQQCWCRKYCNRSLYLWQIVGYTDLSSLNLCLLESNKRCPKLELHTQNTVFVSADTKPWAAAHLPTGRFMIHTWIHASWSMLGMYLNLNLHYQLRSEMKRPFPQGSHFNISLPQLGVIPISFCKALVTIAHSFFIVKAISHLCHPPSHDKL